MDTAASPPATRPWPFDQPYMNLAVPLVHPDLVAALEYTWRASAAGESNSRGQVRQLLYALSITIDFLHGQYDCVALALGLDVTRGSKLQGGPTYEKQKSCPAETRGPSPRFEPDRFDEAENTLRVDP